MKKPIWIVTGMAYVPVEIRIEINAETGSIAGQAAQRLFDAAPNKETFIVPNSNDNAAVHSFRWSAVEPKL